MKIEEYVSSFGFSISDLTDEELEKVKYEVDAINKGMNVLDGVLASKPIYGKNRL